MLFACYCVVNSQNISINNSEKSLVTYLLTSIPPALLKKADKVAQKKEQ